MAEGSKTEKATPKKRRDERKKGNVFLSRDAVAVATLAASFFTFWVLVGSLADQLGQYFEFCMTAFIQPGIGVESMTRKFAYQGLMILLKGVGPVMAVTVIIAIAATFLQTNFLVAGESLKPKFNRISPLQGFKRLFSLRGVVETFKGLLKIVILMVIIFLSLKDMFQESSKYLYTDIPVGCAHLLSVAMGMIIRIIIAFVALAAMDFLYQWWEYERQMKMTKEEVKEEYKQLEGDPKVKSKIKEIQRKMAQTRMMQQVPQADVVIRNPTHFAVALRYKPEEDAAPVVLAKGQDELALRIVKVAEENKVAVIENVPLARTLYAETELNRAIPPALYGAVAEVLVYIFRLNEEQKIVK